uniref:hypothetical protein n=1 Tax=Paenibacillus sp. IHBB 10380 TaxID=1566358 RepID=UPI001F25F510|nr:hypothetical protein [Paenibacillus sp. IHBB 10380]
MQQNPPDRLNHRIDRHLVRLGDPVQLTALLLPYGDDHFLLPILPVSFAFPLRRYACLLLITPQVVLPVLQRLFLILLPQPLDVIAVRIRFFQLHALTAFQLNVILEQISQNDPRAPAIHDDVMVTPDHSVRFLSRLNHRQPHQQILAKIESLFPIFFLELFNILPSLILFKIGYVFIMNLGYFFFCSNS